MENLRKKFLYLLAKHNSLSIDISNYVTFDLKVNKKGKIDYHIDNHFAFNKNQYDLEDMTKFDLDGVLDVRQVKQFIELLFDKENEFKEHKQIAKESALYDLQWNIHPSFETESTITDILELVESKNRVDFGNFSVIIADETNKAVEPIGENVHFQIVLQNKLPDGKTNREFPNLSVTETLNFLKEQVEQNKNLENFITKEKTALDKQKFHEQAVFNTLCARYNPKEMVK